MSTDARARVRQLLLSGDNVIKNREEPARVDRARERYVRAREIAAAEALGPAVLELIDRRLDALGRLAEQASSPASERDARRDPVGSPAETPRGTIPTVVSSNEITLRPEALEFDLFSGIGREHVAGLTRGLVPLSVAAGQAIDLASEEHACSLLWSGRLALVYMTESSGQRTVTLVEEGDVLVPPPATSAQVGPDIRCRALVPSVILRLDDARLERWLLTPGLAVNLLRVLSAQVADRELAAAIALESRVETRLLLKLRQLALRWGRVTSKGIRLDLRLTHQELADMVGAVRESVTLAFGRLAAQGEIEVIDRAILIPAERLTQDAQDSSTTASAKRP